MLTLLAVTRLLQSQHGSLDRNSQLHTFMHTYMHAYIHTYIHAYIHTYIHTYITNTKLPINNQ